MVPCLVSGISVLFLPRTTPSDWNIEAIPSTQSDVEQNPTCICGLLLSVFPSWTQPSLSMRPARNAFLHESDELDRASGIFFFQFVLSTRNSQSHRSRQWMSKSSEVFFFLKALLVLSLEEREISVHPRFLNRFSVSSTKSTSITLRRKCLTHPRFLICMIWTFPS